MISMTTTVIYLLAKLVVVSSQEDWRYTDINECESSVNPCMNGGTCRDTVGSFECICLEQWSGPTCQNDICMNGGTCINTHGSYLCNCPPEWTGTHCENDVNECELGQSRCDNGATCINTIGGYECICPVGYTGQFCTADINECLFIPCLSGATCINNFGSYVCICLPDYTGPNCEQGIQTSFLMSFPTLNLTYTPDLAFNTSSKLQRHAQLFCNGIDQLMFTHRRRYPDYAGCGVNSFKDNPTRMEWDLKFKGQVTPGTKANAKGFIFESFPRVLYGNALGIEIGDILFFVDKYTTTGLQISKDLLNFTRTPDFENPQNIYASLLCADIDAIMKTHPDKFPTYIDCTVTEFPDQPDRVKFNLTFEGDHKPLQLQEDFNNILYRDLPKIRYDRWLGYKLGDLLVYYQNFTVFTEVPLKFRILNLTWTNDLDNELSGKYRLHAGFFCADIDKLLGGRPDLFPSYDKCKVRRFGNNPVSLEILLDFMGVLLIPEMQQLVAKVIFEDTPRYRHNDVVGHLVGDLLVYYADLLLYQDNTVFDTWLTNSTSKIYGLPWTAADNLSDSNSFKFREYEDTFCSQVDTLFRSEHIRTSPLKQRYYRCFIDNFQHNYLDSEAPTSFTYSLVFNGTEPVIKGELDEILTGTSEVFEFSGSRWILVGDQWLIDEQNFDEIMINISNYLINVVTTPRPMEKVNTLVNMTFRLLNFTMTPQLADRNSAEFKALAGPFCNYLTRAYRDRLPSYESCEVQSFFTKDFGSTQHVNFHLNFRGDQNADLPKLLIAIIIENAHREKINNRISLVVGPLNIFEDSLIQEAQSMVVTGGGTTIATPSVNTLVNMTFRLLNFTMTPQLADRNSAEFKALAAPFCNYLTRAYRDRFPSNESCEVQSFFTKDFGSTQHVNFHLNFRGDQNADLPKLLIAIIIENAHREKINNRISLVVGPLHIFEDSLIQEAQSMVVTGGGTFIATPSDPCQPDNIFFPFPGDDYKFIVCWLGQKYIFECNAGKKFDKTLSKCVETL